MQALKQIFAVAMMACVVLLIATGVVTVVELNTLVAVGAVVT